MDSESKYLRLLINTLTDYHRIINVEYVPIFWGKAGRKKKLLRKLNKLFLKWDYTLCKVNPPDRDKRLVGADWPFYADTMIGVKRLENILELSQIIFKESIPGDFIETGVWRGGATILMKAIIDEYEQKNRKVWVADSFEGLPKPNSQKYRYDKGDLHYTEKVLSVSIDDVKFNFEKYGLLDEDVIFLKGWFKDTLPNAPIEKIALLRLDGDMYESTMDALENLYDKVSIGGYIIVDDWNAVPACKQAIIDFRTQRNIKDELIPIDWASVYWKKSV